MNSIALSNNLTQDQDTIATKTQCSLQAALDSISSLPWVAELFQQLLVLYHQSPRGCHQDQGWPCINVTEQEEPLSTVRQCYFSFGISSSFILHLPLNLFSPKSLTLNHKACSLCVPRGPARLDSQTQERCSKPSLLRVTASLSLCG